MQYVDALLSALSQIFSFEVFPFLIIGAVFGLIVGIIPGLGGHFVLAMLLPFLYNMEAAQGLAFMLGAHVAVAQGGGLTTILFGIPGTGQNAATLLDGPPMTKKGQAGKAVGAALTACFLGGAFGAIALASMLPVLKKVVLLFGAPEIFMLALLSLTFIAVLSKDDMVKGLMAGASGLVLSTVGVDNATNQERFTFGLLQLWDGIELVPMILGMFALSEMVTLWIDGGSIAKNGKSGVSNKAMQKQIFQGVGTTFRKMFLVVRCGVIGTIMGAIPGLGSAAASFVAYGHAKQSSKDPESFGKGNIEGVIGPESANDSVEGGALASTIAFGIPGSSSMAILLGGFFILGIDPGPSMLTSRIDIIYVMIISIILGNLIATVIGLYVANPLARVTFLRGTLLVPILTVVILAGAFVTNRSWFDIGICILFGFIGYIMKEKSYSRPAFLVGFVLGLSVEKNLFLAVQMHGPYFFLKPLPLALMTITILVLLYNVWDMIPRKGDKGNATGHSAN